MAEFTIGDKTYRSDKLDAFKQFHVARKLGPIFAKLGPSGIQPRPNATMADLLAPVVDALAAMSEEDCNYVLHRCLSVVQRFDSNRWTPVWNDPAQRLMYQDIDLQAMIQITLQVLGDNLGPFISAPSQSTEQPASPVSDTPPNLQAFPMAKTG